ncbi:MAG: M20/M25/M40 family metallo-hydrolase, partial [Dehalococcoidia bacterium]|nr:M20/M25/M40 family metallo-hydrolase [Dehalococcoidia bacterium]
MAHQDAAAGTEDAARIEIGTGENGHQSVDEHMQQTNTTHSEVQPDRLRRLLKAMTDIYSPSGKELELLEYLEDYLTRSGLSTRRQKVDENRFNLVVPPPGNMEAELYFVGHMDTVAAHELEDFSYRKKGDTVFGLGTADMKAGCAAMIEAFTVLASEGLPLPPVGLALVVDEEEDNLGAKELVKEYDFPWAVIGEPTDLAPCLGHYGYLEVFLRTQGKRAHSAIPEHGQNAIENMLRLLLSVTQSISSGHHGLVYNIRELSGFPGGFVVPDTCEAYIDLHLPPNSRIDALRSEFEQLVNGAG